MSRGARRECEPDMYPHAADRTSAPGATVGMTVEFDDQGNVIGLEVFRASKVLPEKIVASLPAKQAGVI